MKTEVRAAAPRPDISVLIKALNEEARIADCILSVLRESEGFSVEIIVVDSLSTDQTVEIAKRFPVTIVRFENKEDCGPGAAVELGFRVSNGRFIYILDGDMTLEDGFLRSAMEWLVQNPSYAGVAGVLRDTLVVNYEDRRREASRRNQRGGDQDHLGSGGLYRRTAIEKVEYLGHRGLKAFEEAELGLRLQASGWKLHRLGIPGVAHTGHGIGSFAVIRRHWKSKRIFASGVLLRESLGKPYLGRVVRRFWHLEGVLAYWIVLLYALLTGIHSLVLVMFAAAFVVQVVMFVRKRSISEGFVATLVWHISALGLLGGVLSRPRDPLGAIPHRILHTPMSSSNPARSSATL